MYYVLSPAYRTSARVPGQYGMCARLLFRLLGTSWKYICCERLRFLLPSDSPRGYYAGSVVSYPRVIVELFSKSRFIAFPLYFPNADAAACSSPTGRVRFRIELSYYCEGVHDKIWPFCARTCPKPLWRIFVYRVNRVRTESYGYRETGGI